MSNRTFWIGITVVNLLLFGGMIYLLFVSGSLM